MRSTWWEHVYYLSFMVMSWFNFLFCPSWLLNPQAVYGDAAAAALLLTAEQTGIASEWWGKNLPFLFQFYYLFFSFHLKFLHTDLVLVNVSAPRQNLETHFILLTQTAIEIRACEGKVKIWLILVFHFFQLESSPHRSNNDIPVCTLNTICYNHPYQTTNRKQVTGQVR